jgi:hypothetical protein
LFLRGRDHSEDLGVDEKIIFEWNGEIGWEVVVWIHLVQNRNHWRALVNMIMTPILHGARHYLKS